MFDNSYLLNFVICVWKWVGNHALHSATQTFLFSRENDSTMTNGCYTTIITTFYTYCKPPSTRFSTFDLATVKLFHKLVLVYPPVSQSEAKYFPTSEINIFRYCRNVTRGDSPTHPVVSDHKCKSLLSFFFPPHQLRCNCALVVQKLMQLGWKTALKMQILCRFKAGGQHHQQRTDQIIDAASQIPVWHLFDSKVENFNFKLKIIWHCWDLGQFYDHNKVLASLFYRHLDQFHEKSKLLYLLAKLVRPDWVQTKD